MNTRWKCRNALVSDATAIWKIHVDCIHTLCSSFYSQEQIENWAGRQKPERFAAFIQGKGDFVVIEDTAQTSPTIVGFGHLGRCNNQQFSQAVDFEIYGFYVSPLVTRQGAGYFMYEELKTRALHQGGIRLGVCSTLNAVPFYEACGFNTIKEAVHCPGDLNMSCIILEQDIQKQTLNVST